MRIRLTKEVRHLPIVVRPEDVRLPRKKLRKDILYRLGLEEGKQIGIEEGKQIGLEEGLLRSAQEMVLTLIEGRLGHMPEGVSDKIRSVKDREFLRALAKRLVVAEDVLKVLKEELGI